MMTIQQRVEKGAEWLDQNHPGWERKIDLNILDLSSCSECVIGQIFGEYCDALQTITPDEWKADLAISWAAARGFNSATTESVDELHRDYKDLREAWVPLIKERFNSGKLSDSC